MRLAVRITVAQAAVAGAGCLRHPVTERFWILVLVFAGGGLGSLARFGVSAVSARWFGETFPWGTLIANVSGSFAIGFFATLTEPDGRLLVSPPGRAFFMIGVCGGYTTFSSFSLQTLSLLRDGEWIPAGGNVLLSVTLCLLGVWLGHLAAATLNSLRGG